MVGGRIQELVLDMDAHDLAEDDAGAADFHAGQFTAFEAGGGIGDSPVKVRQ